MDIRKLTEEELQSWIESCAGRRRELNEEIDVRVEERDAMEILGSSLARERTYRRQRQAVLSHFGGRGGSLEVGRRPGHPIWFGPGSPTN